MAFLHGVEVIEIDSGSRPIRTARSSVIGIVGTAPDADPAKYPYNKPVLLTSLAEAKGIYQNDNAPNKGSLPSALKAIYSQAGAVVVVVRVEEDTQDAKNTIANVAGGTDADGNYKGIYSLLGAKTALDVTPRLLLAPDYSGELTSGQGGKIANPVASALVTIAEKLRGVAIIDGPNTTDAEAKEAAKLYGSSRAYLVDPQVITLGEDGALVTEPSSPFVAGAIARSDNDRGFWFSPSNQTLFNVLGLARPIDFKLGDKNARANLLNESNVTTIIREGGFRLWGNRTLSADPKWAFLSVRRTADILNDSLLNAHMWAVDRNITKTYIEEVTEGVNGFIRSLIAQGALINGKCWADPELNSVANISQGKVYFNFDFCPPYPAEHITFRSKLENNYLNDLVEG